MKNFLVCLLLFASVFIIQSCEKELTNNSFQNTDDPELLDASLRRSCDMNAHMGKLLADPDYARQHQSKFEKLAEIRNNVQHRTTCDNPPIIPVAVHFQGVQNGDIACLIALAESQIRILNDDFRGENQDISKWKDNASSAFAGLANAETCVKFALANKNHPAGFNLQEGDLAVTLNQTNGDFNQTWSGYLNIYVQFDTGLLGYSPLGGAGNGDGVVIDASAFGTGSGCGAISPENPFNLGRTTTHEVGHYLLLDHIWGDGCGIDDEVFDTPESDEPYYDCPQIGAKSCGSTDMHMNYMDYTNDDCMYMFSAGQAVRSENYIKSSLQILIGNASNVITGAIDNGDDSDVDPDDSDDNAGDDNDNDDETTDVVDSDCEAEAVDYYDGTALKDDACYQEVIAIDEYCCGVEFDYLCQEAYDECAGVSTSGSCKVTAVDYNSGQVLMDACVDEVQEYDTYCCETEWDMLCQYYYDDCSYYGKKMTDFKSNDAMVLVGKNPISGKVQITYALKNWNPMTELLITVDGKKILSEKVTSRRGSIEKDLLQYRHSGVKAISLVQGKTKVAEVKY